MTQTTFTALGLTEPLLRALETRKFTIPTPIQADTVPALLAGQDLLGVAQTGSGKTAAFTLPILQHLAAQQIRPAPFVARALILAPTRELALQIDETVRALSIHLPRLRTVVIIGGASFLGGRGTVDNALVGAVMIGVIRNGMNLLNVDAFLQPIVIGVVIVLAVESDVIRARVEERFRVLQASLQ